MLNSKFAFVEGTDGISFNSNFDTWNTSILKIGNIVLFSVNMSLKSGKTFAAGETWCVVPDGFKPIIGVAQNMPANIATSAVVSLMVNSDGKVTHRGTSLSGGNGFRAAFVYLTN